MAASIRRGLGIVVVAALAPASWALARQSGTSFDATGPRTVPASTPELFPTPAPFTTT